MKPNNTINVMDEELSLINSLSKWESYPRPPGLIPTQTRDFSLSMSEISS